MKSLPEFKLETHFAKWEFKAQHHMTASDAESMSLRNLLAMATDDEREEFEGLWLGYTETFGAPDLRETISELYEQRSSDDVLCFAGASEGIFAANTVLLDSGSHAIAITPNYQSHETLPLAICDTTGIPLNPLDNWSLDIDRVADAIKPNTTLLTINFPHNPTGAILPRDRLDSLVALCRKHGIYILSDEIFNGLGRTGVTHLPHVADIYERGLSLNVMSKAYGLPGLRLGWIACADHEVLTKMERTKHYLSISNSGPSERLTKIALKNHAKILARNCQIIDRNLVKLDAFFSQYTDLFDWQVSDGSCMAFPRYKGTDGVEHFTQQLLERAGVLLLPSSIYSSDLGPTPNDRFRIGFGRAAMDEGLLAMENYLGEL
ncbi:MAG: aminotransferase class I/II-fold pyridoxal phosphate-dependent enzyme [Gammaproteobacteria bacterium]|nr:aminotransferase class I/II-fold pyridoxal phosphate-dependent enzyme [Gammaproteobacteria bacterium]